MLKKILKTTAIILCIGFISSFVRGYAYQSSSPTKKEKIFDDVTTKSEKQEMIDDDTISELLDTSNNNDTSGSNDNSTSTSVETKVKKNNSNTNNSNSTNNQTNSNNIEVKKEEVQEATNSTTTSDTSTTKSNSYIGVPNPTDFYYSFHHGVIEYSNMEDCLKDTATVSFADTVDILNTWCVDVVDSEGTLLGEYLYINCSSGNCNRYKDVLKN